MMRTVWTIATRELKRYFTSPIAYVTGFFFLLILGAIFWGTLEIAAQTQQVPQVQDTASLLVFLLVIGTPAITMHLIAEEQRMGTVELMLTAPVRDWEFVVGKWLGAVLFMLILVAITLIYPLTLNQLVSPGIDQGILIANYVGLALVVMAIVAIGVMISAFFKHQVAAFLVSLVICLGLWIISIFTRNSPNELLAYLDFRDHYLATFLRGVIDIRDVVYYLSLTVAALFIGSIVVETRRWR